MSIYLEMDTLLYRWVTDQSSGASRPRSLGGYITLPLSNKQKLGRFAPSLLEWLHYLAVWSQTKATFHQIDRLL
jgi:hypothetical protein